MANLNTAQNLRLGGATPLFKKISGVGSQDLIAAVSGAKIKLVGFMFTSSAATTVKFQSGGATDLTGAMTLVINTGLGDSVEFPSWLMETVAGEKLNLVDTGGGTIAGYLRYFLD